MSMLINGLQYCSHTSVGLMPCVT